VVMTKRTHQDQALSNPTDLQQTSTERTALDPRCRFLREIATALNERRRSD
jgi:hypothetical protein